MLHYHVSDKDLGDKFEFTPRFPSTANPAECSKTKRVCFAPTVWQCMIGICGTSAVSDIIQQFLYTAVEKGTQPAVYETRRVLVKPPKIVSDYKVTGEMWSTVPITCKRRGYIDLMHLLKRGEIRITKTPNVVISKEFYAGWKAAIKHADVNWKTDPPDQVKG